MSPEDADPLLDMLATLSGAKKPATPVSASSLSQTVKAGVPSKRRKYDTSQAVEELYRKHAVSLRQGDRGLYGEVAFGIYSIYRPRIIKIARKYRSLSPIFGEDDLQQEALIAILQALRKYRHSSDIRMKFSTYLEWSIRNIFQRAIGNRDKYVEIYRPDGSFERTMAYGKFVEQKKALEHSGHTYTTKKRFSYLSEAQGDEDLEAKLSETNPAPYEYSSCSDDEPEESADEMQDAEADEEEAEEEPREDRQTPMPSNTSGSNGLNLQMIDGLYRQWTRSPSRSHVSANDAVVLRIYELCNRDGEAFFLSLGNNGTSTNAEEMKQSMLAVIARSLACHNDDSVPRTPFSMFLRVAMKRSMQTLRSDKP